MDDLDLVNHELAKSFFEFFSPGSVGAFPGKLKLTVMDRPACVIASLVYSLGVSVQQRFSVQSLPVGVHREEPALGLGWAVRALGDGLASGRAIDEYSLRLA
jgi:hypothetical protein